MTRNQTDSMGGLWDWERSAMTHIHTNLKTLLFASITPTWVKPWQMDTPRMGMTTILPKASVLMTPRGSEQRRPPGVPRLASTDPSVISLKGADVPPMKVAVFNLTESRGYPPGAGEVFTPWTLGTKKASREATDIIKVVMMEGIIKDWMKLYARLVRRPGMFGLCLFVCGHRRMLVLSDDNPYGNRTVARTTRWNCSCCMDFRRSRYFLRVITLIFHKKLCETEQPLV
ncbi:hypothetical protein BDN67DRAFT_972786, partial [Paxillus ammoniavirescens]